jgi:hypothetical protein
MVHLHKLLTTDYLEMPTCKIANIDSCTKDRPVLSSERASYIDKPVIV